MAAPAGGAGGSGEGRQSRMTTILLMVVLLQLVCSLMLLTTVNHRLRNIQVVGGPAVVAHGGDALPLGLEEQQQARSLRAGERTPLAVTNSDTTKTIGQQTEGVAAATAAVATAKATSPAAAAASTVTSTVARSEQSWRTLCCEDNGIANSKRYWVDTPAKSGNASVMDMRTAILAYLQSPAFKEKLAGGFAKPSGSGGEACPCVLDSSRVTRGIVIPTGEPWLCARLLRLHVPCCGPASRASCVVRHALFAA